DFLLVEAAPARLTCGIVVGLGHERRLRLPGDRRRLRLDGNTVLLALQRTGWAGVYCRTRVVSDLVPSPTAPLSSEGLFASFAANVGAGARSPTPDEVQGAAQALREILAAAIAVHGHLAVAEGRFLAHLAR